MTTSPSSAAAPLTDPPPRRDDAPRPERSSWRRRLAYAVLAVVVVLLALWAWRRFFDAPPAKVAPPATVPVTSAPVTERNVPIFRSGVGTVGAQQSVTVRVRVDGQLERVDFIEGQDVKAGQLLAQLDPRTFQAQLEQAQAQRARDLAQLGNARADLARYTNLLAQDAATQQQVDTQKALVAQLQAAVQTDEAQVHYQQVQLGYTRIVAPISGRTGARLVDVGNIVHAADANGLVVINQVDPVAVTFTLPEESFQDVNQALQRADQPLQVIAYPRNGENALGSGKLTLLNNQIDTTTGTVQLKARFPNPGHALWPGQYVNVRLVLGRDPHALTVPASAVQRSQNGEFVWVVDAAGKARNQPVSVASIQDGLAVIRRGVAANERVVVDGQYKLREGIAVAESRPASGASGNGNGNGVAKDKGAGAEASTADAAGSGNVAVHDGGEGGADRDASHGNALDRPVAENEPNRAVRASRR